MALKQFSAGKATIVASLRNRANLVPKALAEAPGGLYPLRMAHWVTDEYRIAAGWPRPEPDYDVRARTLISCTGEALAFRQGPRAITTGASVRWIADEDTFDTTALQWVPYQNDLDLVWESSVDYSPTFISDYEYVIGTETFIETALNFDADSAEHMWCDMNSVLGGASGYSVVMCLSLNSVYGNNLTIPYAGLWSPGMATPAVGEPISESPTDGWVSLTAQGNWLYLETDQSPRTRAVQINDLMASTAPIMIGLVIGRPVTVVYAGRGPSNIRRAQMNVGTENTPMSGNVVLGRTNGDILHTADMALLDLGIYPDRLSPGEMKAEFSALSAVYGSDK